mgnify:FL=1
MFEFLITWQFWVVVSLLIISGIAKAVQDTLDFHYWKSIFSKSKYHNWLNPNESWENKYKWFPNSKILTWLFSNPLVLFTDAWHTFGFIRNFSIFSTIPIISGNYFLFLLYPVFTLTFHIFFTYILINKTK